MALPPPLFCLICMCYLCLSAAAAADDCLAPLLAHSLRKWYSYKRPRGQVPLVQPLNYERIPETLIATNATVCLRMCFFGERHLQFVLWPMQDQMQDFLMISRLWNTANRTNRTLVPTHVGRIEGDARITNSSVMCNLIGGIFYGEFDFYVKSNGTTGNGRQELKSFEVHRADTAFSADQIRANGNFHSFIVSW